MSNKEHISPFDPDQHGKRKLSDDKLMAYLNGDMTPEEQHEMEQLMTEDGMDGDALEGLKLLGAAETKDTVEKLNRNLRKTIHSKKSKRGPLKNDQFIIMAIAIILLLIVLAYIVVRKSI